jgi:hypothetical protein
MSNVFVVASISLFSEFDLFLLLLPGTALKTPSSPKASSAMPGDQFSTATAVRGCFKRGGHFLVRCDQFSTTATEFAQQSDDTFEVAMPALVYDLMALGLEMDVWIFELSVFVFAKTANMDIRIRIRFQYRCQMDVFEFDL